MKTDRKQRIAAALAILGNLPSAEIARLADDAITAQTVGNIRRMGFVKRRLPESTVRAFEAAAKAFASERAA